MTSRDLRRLALVPAVLALAAVVLAGVLRDPARLAAAYRALALVAYAAAGVAAAAAAAALGPREWLGRAWLLFGASFVLLVPARLLRTPSDVGLFPGELATSALGNVFGGAAAVCGIAGAWLLARTWRRSGLPEPALALRAAVGVAALALGLLLTAPDLVRTLPRAADGDPFAIESALWSLEYVVLALVAVPLLHTTVRMRAGLLRWPWAYLAAGVGAFLLYDAWSLAPGDLPARAVRATDEVLRGVGCGFVAAAALAQRRLARTAPAVRAGDAAGSAPRR